MKKLHFKKIFLTLFILGILTITYSFFIERNLITVNEFEIKSTFEGKIIVISDLHLGKWKDEKFLKKIVDKINTEIKNKNIEHVFIAGDFTYHPKDISEKGLDTLFSPLAQISAPVYSVLGNHDEEKPGPKLAEVLKKVLEKNNVKIIENKKQ